MCAITSKGMKVDCSVIGGHLIPYGTVNTSGSQLIVTKLNMGRALKVLQQRDSSCLADRPRHWWTTYTTCSTAVQRPCTVLMNGTSIVSHADLPNESTSDGIACLKLDEAGCWNKLLRHFLKFFVKKSLLALK